jgi:TrbL/VirB6 plasmid conjugal transfer protein
VRSLPVLATTVALACWLLLAVPAHAQQAPNPLAALVDAGAPLVALAPSTSAGGTTADPVAVAAASTNPSQPDAAPARSAGGVAPGVQPGISPEIGIPNPLDLLGALDPRKWAGDILDAVITTIGGALIEAMRELVDWALGLGGSSLNFVTRTPAAGSYESATVRSLWDFSRAIVSVGLAAIVMWGGFNLIIKQHTRSPYHEAMELLPRVILAALAANLTLEFARVLIDLNNGFAGAIGQVGLPGYEQASTSQEGMAAVFMAVTYGIVVLLLVLQMLMRLALIDLLIVLSPVMMLLWVLPQTQGWTRWWTSLFPITVFQQAVQMIVLRLGAALMVELTPGSVSNALLTLLLGIAVCWLTLKVPSLLRGQVQHAGLGSVVNLLVLGKVGGSLAARGGAAAAGAGR